MAHRLRAIAGGTLNAYHRRMSTKRKILIGFVIALVILGGFLFWVTRGDTATKTMAEVTGPKPFLVEAESQTIPTVAIAKPVGWAKGQAPEAAKGLEVTRFAEGLDHPRTMITLPNGDVIVALTNAPPGNKPGGIVGLVMVTLMERAGAFGPSPNKLVLLRDADGDGRAEQKVVLREGLNSPSGMAWGGGKLYVAEHNALLAFPFEPGATKLDGKPDKLMDLPPGGGHWMRNVVLSPDGTKVYVAVGSASNIGEGGMELEKGRAAIWEYDLTTKTRRQYAGGMRNPNGMAWNPATGELWTTVNERDMIGSDLVPDYLTNVPVGAQYGWPWVYWKKVIDWRVTEPMPNFLTEYSRKPEYALGPHVAALGLVFTGEGHVMGPDFANGAFIARHGSWNRKPMSGYDLIFVPFDKLGNPVGQPKTVLKGFLTGDGDTHGRPTWLTWDKSGALLMTDDTAGIVWRIRAPGAKPAIKPEVVKSTPLPPQRELRGDPRRAFDEDFKGDYVKIG